MISQHLINELTIRRATIDDVPSMVTLMTDDELGKTREVDSIPLNPSYYAAFEKIDQNPHSELLVVEFQGKVIGTAQVDYLQYLSHQGAKRAQIENVRVDKSYRSQGVGEKLMAVIVDKAKQKGCYIVQLTTNKKRHRAHHFYERLGFVASHEGMKLQLL